MSARPPIVQELLRQRRWELVRPLLQALERMEGQEQPGHRWMLRRVRLEDRRAEPKETMITRRMKRGGCPNRPQLRVDGTMGGRGVREGDE